MVTSQLVRDHQGTVPNLRWDRWALKFQFELQKFLWVQIRFIQELGEGTFGKVYKGEMIGYHDNSITKVAIKTLKESASPKDPERLPQRSGSDDRPEASQHCVSVRCVHERKNQCVCCLSTCPTETLHEYLDNALTPFWHVSVSDDEGAWVYPGALRKCCT